MLLRIGFVTVIGDVNMAKFRNLPLGLANPGCIA